MANIQGSSLKDVLIGSSEGDSIQGLAGNDVIYGLAGNDMVWAGPGHDTVSGGDGDDQLVGNEGDDTLLGEAGDDKIWGDAGDDHAVGGPGRDDLVGGEGNDTLEGGEDADGLWGDAGNDYLFGGDGPDQIVGGDGDDLLDGGAGDDWMWAEEGRDKLVAGQGNDFLSGGPGDDRLEGGRGDDQLHGDEGSDLLDGGAGRDLLYGGDGVDTATWPELKSGYRILNAGTYLEVRNLSTGEIDKVDRAIEFLRFGDETFPATAFGPELVDFLGLSRPERQSIAEQQAQTLLLPSGQRFAAKHVTYSFLVDAPSDFRGYYVPAGAQLEFKALTPFLQASAKQIFQALSAALDMEFVQVEGASDIQLGMHNMTMGGYGSYPVPGQASLVMINSGLVGNGLRGSAVGVLLHEIGHALGLDHSFDNSVFDGGQPGFGAAGNSLPIELDSGALTVMSYRNVLIDEAGPASFQALDMAALSMLYGERKSVSANKYTVEFDPSVKTSGQLLDGMPNQTLAETTVIEAYAPYMIYDTGGFDTLELQGCRAPAYVNLSQGTVRIGAGAAEVLTSGGMSTILSNVAPIITMYPSTTIEAVRGTSLADTYVGSAGCDLFEGRGGNDMIDGGDGVDTAEYAGERGSYSVVARAGQIIVTDLRGSEGVDTLVSVERLVFRDQALAFDLDGNAGVVAKLIGALFGAEQLSNRALVSAGLKFIDEGASPSDLSSIALNYRLGANATASDVLALLAHNVFGGHPSTSKQAQFGTQILAHGSDPVSLVLLAADSPLNQINIDLVGLSEHGLAFEAI